MLASGQPLIDVLDIFESFLDIYIHIFSRKLKQFYQSYCALNYIKKEKKIFCPQGVQI